MDLNLFPFQSTALSIKYSVRAVERQKQRIAIGCEWNKRIVEPIKKRIGSESFC